jgi:hypothetical protein
MFRLWFVSRFLLRSTKPLLQSRNASVVMATAQLYWHVAPRPEVNKGFLKVMTNEKRGGLNLVLFDWSCFKLFTLKFSKESVQAPSYERPKTATVLSEPCFCHLKSTIVSQ